MKRSMVFEGIVTILLIALLFLLYIAIATSNVRDYNWEIAGNGSVSGVYLGENGTLYAFTGTNGNTIYSIDGNGTIRWKYQVPGQWSVINKPGQGYPCPSVLSVTPDAPLFTTNNGTLYLYIRERGDSPPLAEELLAISSSGKTLWDMPIGNYSEPNSDIRISVENGSVYAYTDYAVTVLNASGSVLFRVDHVSDPPAVDEHGTMYLSVSRADCEGWGYQPPLGIIESYNPVGSVEWAYQVDGTLARPSVDEHVRQLYDSLPVYQDGLLYVPVKNGITVLYTNGSVKWSRELGEGLFSLFYLMPFDEHGNIYIVQNTDFGIDLKILDKDGNDLVDGENVFYDQFSTACGDPYSGRLYYYDGMDYHGQPALDNLITYKIAAYDLLGNKKLWNYSIPLENTSSLIVNRNNVNMLGLLDGGGAESYVILHNRSSKNPAIGSKQALTIVPSKDSIYLSFYTVNYQAPLVMGRSKCMYSSAIYALGEDGTLHWSKPTDSFAISLAARNSTIYYGTRGGKIVSAQMNSVVGGIALIALTYVFFRFFLVGAATRARSRLDKNENRNRILGFIGRNPGLTIQEISRGTGVNLGTTRYHVLILGLNHKIIASQADRKYVRYFANSSSYSKGEQLILSLMRREAVGRVLGILLEKPGISNVEMAKELGMQESVVCRCIKELSEKGIVTGLRGDAGRSVVEAYREHVLAAMRRING